jgi:hypothetical protein
MSRVDTLFSRSATRAVALVVVCIHFALCLYISKTPAEGSWQWFPLFVVDFPASLVALFLVRPAISAFPIYTLVGSLWWYGVVTGIGFLVRKSRESSAAA